MRYLEHLHDETNGVTVREFVETLVSVNLGAFGPVGEFVDAYATEEVFVTGTSIVVPGRCVYNEKTTNDFLDATGMNIGPDLTFGVLACEKVVSACEGYHLEALAGDCLLADVPAGTAVPEFSLSFAETPIPVIVSDEE